MRGLHSHRHRYRFFAWLFPPHYYFTTITMMIWWLYLLNNVSASPLLLMWLAIHSNELDGKKERRRIRTRDDPCPLPLISSNFEDVLFLSFKIPSNVIVFTVTFYCLLAYACLYVFLFYMCKLKLREWKIEWSSLSFVKWVEWSHLKRSFQINL